MDWLKEIVDFIKDSIYIYTKGSINNDYSSF